MDVSAPAEPAATITPPAPCATAGNTTVDFAGSIIVMSFFSTEGAAAAAPATSDEKVVGVAGVAGGVAFSADELEAEALLAPDDFEAIRLRGVPLPRCRCCRRFPVRISSAAMCGEGGGCY